MTEEDARKVNDLFKQIDVLTAQNETLKDHGGGSVDLTPVLNRLDDIEELLKGLKK